MVTRTRLILIVVLVGLFAHNGFTALAGQPISKNSESRRRPNFILFLVDDLGWQDLSVPLYSEKTPFNERYRTPNVERLAARGMRFTDSYASAPVCTPTRTSIMTGSSPGQTHITYWTLNKDRDTSRNHPTLQPPAWNMNGLQSGDVTLPKLLREAGYRTIHVGKAHFGAHDTSGADPTNLGFDVNIAGHASGGPASYYGLDHFTVSGRQGKEPHSIPSVWDIPGLEKYHGHDIYLTEALAIEASHAIRNAVDNGQPFYMNFAPYAVHAPIMANKRYLAHYEDLHPTEAAYATMVETYDAALGALVETLKDADQLDNTIIIFSSDNGGLSAHARGGRPHTHNAPLRSGKGSAYEGGTRVPTIIVWPGVTTGNSVCAAPIVSHDFFPTILGMAGVRVPEEYAASVEGQILLPLLMPDSGRTFDAERAIFWHQPHQWGADGPGIEPFTSIRQGDWKLIYFHADARFELYNLANDIGEHDNLVDANPEIVTALAASMQDWIDRFDVQMSISKQTGEPIPGPIAVWDQLRKNDDAIIRQAVECVPHPRQIAWQETEFSAFVHFGVNTFTDREWGTGREDPAIFNPTDFDADQWVRAFKDAGMRMVILTAKHHDGFCLWPSRYTTHSVVSSPWRGGHGDVVREVADACQRHGLKFGFYLSPADLYQIESPNGYYGNGSTPRPSVIPSIRQPTTLTECTFEFTVDDYNRYFLNQLYELLTNYGPIDEVWFDGANPKPGTGQTYDYKAWYTLIRSLAPDAVIAIKGPDVRWVGNEAGRSRASEWSVIPLDAPPEEATWPDMTAEDLGSRERIRGAKIFHWYPAETNTSIRPGWFYHASQDDQVKSLDQLLDIYYGSVGNNSLFLLNVPPDRRGLIHENDATRLREFGLMITETFANNLAGGAEVSSAQTLTEHPAASILDGDPSTFWTSPEGTVEATLELDLPERRRFNVVELREHVESSQRIEQHAIDVWIGGGWSELVKGTTVGFRKLHRIPAVETDRIRIRILQSRIRPTLAEVGLFRAPNEP